MFKHLKAFLKKKENTLFLIILLIASFLRLYEIAGYMTFLGDEGRDMLVAYNILHGNFTLLGPTASVGGFFMGPLYYYFIAPFLWLFNYNPVGPSVMVALFGIATVWLIYKVTAEFFDTKAAIFASSLYAVSPLVIAYSRSSWNPNLMPFFSLLMLYTLYHAVRKSSPKLLFLSGVLYGILLELHYIVTFLAVIIVVYILFIGLKPCKGSVLTKIASIGKHYFFVFLGSLVGFSPFLLFEVRHGFPNFRSISNFIFNSGETGTNLHFFSSIWDIFFRLFGRLITKFPPPEQISVQVSTTNVDLYFNVFKVSVSYLYFGTVLLAFATLLILFKKSLKALRENKDDFQNLALLFVWLFVGVFLFGFYRKAVYDYYLEFMFPLPFILVGSLFSSLYSNKFLKPLSLGVFLILILLNLSGAPFRYPPNRQLAQVEKISRFVSDKTEGKPFNFALITKGNSDHAYRYFFTLWDHEPLTIQNTQVDPKKTTITDQLLIVCEDPTCQPLGNSLWEVAGFGRGEIAGQWDVSVVKVFKLVHYQGK
ncbi:MAG: glycosyltransferase family 39 protein [Candidatus Levybacteria bacterium]|nr:glycosyltransferase family 39 protein [Candidatus Levybacteria bacterium]